MLLRTPVDTTEQCAKTLRELIASEHPNLAVEQQKKIRQHLSVTGRDVRLCVRPNAAGDRWDVSLSGKSLTERMTPFMKELCKSDRDGFKQTRPAPHQPFWRIKQFEHVVAAVKEYAKTKP